MTQSRIHVRSIIYILLIVASSNTCRAQEGPFSIEQILSAPFPSELTVSSESGELAWIMNSEGARNIWVAQPPNYRAAAVTQNAIDDGVAMSNLSWLPDATGLVYVSGGDANRAGEIPNPLSDHQGTEQAVYLVKLDDHSQIKLASGNSPAVCPNGEGIAFIRGGKIWWIDLPLVDGDHSSNRSGEDEVDSPAAVQLIQGRGSMGNLRWSPDGSKLAFVSNRGTHSFIGVYDRERKELRYLDPSVDRDRAPVWSPDSTQLAFIRFPATRDASIFAPERIADEPWTIRVADAATGQATEVWRADSGRGSVFRTLDAKDQLFWTASGEIVFPWERDGWTHLYSVPVAGGDSELLTPGDFEVENTVLSDDRTTIFYSSNQNDIDRRHLWSLELPSGSPRQLTSGNTSQWSPTPIGDGQTLAFIEAGATTPAQPCLLFGNRQFPLTSLPDSFPTEHLVIPEQVVFSAADGMQIHGQLFLPPSETNERKPAVVYFHGGSRRQMLLGFHYSSYYHNCYSMNQYLASQGYVVLSVNYRSGIGYGMEFREAIDYGATGASEFNDVLGAGLYLRSREDVDQNRIGLYGGSYGGYLTALGLARASDLFAAGVDIHGVHDWNVTIKGFIPSYNELADPERAKLAFESSPMASLETWRSPVLLIHGDDDRNVPFEESVNLTAELRKRDVVVEHLVFPDEIHGFLLHSNWLAAFRASDDFFKRFLKHSSQTGE